MPPSSLRMAPTCATCTAPILRAPEGTSGKVACHVIFAGACCSLSRRGLSREVVRFEEWLARHYGDDSPSPEVAGVVITLVAQGIGGGVQPVQVLPTDRLDEDFTFRLFGTAIDRGVLLNAPLERLGEELGPWFKAQTNRELELDLGWVTINEVIRGVSVQYRAP